MAPNLDFKRRWWSWSDRFCWTKDQGALQLIAACRFILVNTEILPYQKRQSHNCGLALILGLHPWSSQPFWPFQHQACLGSSRTLSTLGQSVQHRGSLSQTPIMIPKITYSFHQSTHCLTPWVMLLTWQHTESITCDTSKWNASASIASPLDLGRFLFLM